MKKLLTIALLFSVVHLSSQESDSLKYRISLRDKAATSYSLDHPEAYLSQKSIERRKKQGVAIDSTDLPVCQTYIDAIKQQGVSIVTIGKWDNFVTVSCNDTTLIEQIAKLPFVSSTERVWKAPRKSKSKNPTRDSLLNIIQHSDTIYGKAYRQIQLSNGDKLHDAGFKGKIGRAHV